MPQRESHPRPIPILLESPEQSRRLQYVPLDRTPFSESTLQELIRKHPLMLPISELEPTYAPAISIGREVATPSGPLDNLFISPAGGLTLVETKLWRNPEARRQVVSQILDYAKHIVRWTYRDVENAARAYLAKFEQFSGSLHEWISQQSPGELEESDFIDSVSRNLEAGRVLLLIVGDGIRRSVEEMVEYLQGTPHLQFHLALIELRCFRISEEDWPVLISPTVIAKTAEIERAVIRIELSQAAQDVLSVSTNAPSATRRDSSSQVRLSMTEGSFYDRLAAVSGQDVAEKTRQFASHVESLHDDLIVDIQTRMLLRWQPRLSSYSRSPVLLELDAKRGVLWTMLSRAWREQILPRQIIESFWKAMEKIDYRLHPKLDSQGYFIGREQYPKISEIVEKFPAIADAALQFVLSAEAYLASIDTT